MYRDSCQRGRLTVFFSVGSKPLNNWETHIKDGYITSFMDPDIKSMVYELGGVNVSTTYMVCPKGKTVLGISMPFLIIIAKNMKKYFTFEITILDDTGAKRRFRVANFQSSTQILPLSTVMPIGLADGWNQIQFNLFEITSRAYKKKFVEVLKIKINANVRLRRIYFAERLVPEEELPPDFRLFFPMSHKESTVLKRMSAAKKSKEKVFEREAPINGNIDQAILLGLELPVKKQIEEMSKEKLFDKQVSGDEVFETEVHEEVHGEEVDEDEVPIEGAPVLEFTGSKDDVLVIDDTAVKPEEETLTPTNSVMILAADEQAPQEISQEQIDSITKLKSNSDLISTPDENVAPGASSVKVGSKASVTKGDDRGSRVKVPSRLPSATKSSSRTKPNETEVLQVSTRTTSQFRVGSKFSVQKGDAHTTQQKVSSSRKSSVQKGGAYTIQEKVSSSSTSSASKGDPLTTQEKIILRLSSVTKSRVGKPSATVVPQVSAATTSRNSKKYGSKSTVQKVDSQASQEKVSSKLSSKKSISSAGYWFDSKRS